MSEYDETIRRATEKLKEPVRINPSLNARVMAEVNRLPAYSRDESAVKSVWRWFQSPRTVRISPLGGLAAVAAFGLVVFLGVRGRNETSLVDTRMAMAGANAIPVIQFVLVAPDAGTVALVGDFNDWDTTATPLMRGVGDGVWSVTVPLSPGRYRYSFLVDGTTWLRDPQAARTVEDEFGRPNSVLTIGGA